MVTVRSQTDNHLVLLCQHLVPSCVVTTIMELANPSVEEILYGTNARELFSSTAGGHPPPRHRTLSQRRWCRGPRRGELVPRRSRDYSRIEHSLGSPLGRSQRPGSGLYRGVRI